MGFYKYCSKAEKNEQQLSGSHVEVRDQRRGDKLVGVFGFRLKLKLSGQEKKKKKASKRFDCFVEFFSSKLKLVYFLIVASRHLGHDLLQVHTWNRRNKEDDLGI